MPMSPSSLNTTYGTVTPDDLANNLEKMNATWSPTQPIEDLWNQIHKCQSYAEAYDPISNPMAVCSAVANLTISGVFADALCDWRRKPITDQTWNNLLTHFNEVDKERHHTLTSTEAGYANTAQQKPQTNNPPFINMGYCWSHGLTANSNHTSKT